MLDKKEKNAYIWYSGATDITGTNLARALGVDHGRVKPDFSKYNFVIGWGTKTKQDHQFGKIQTLNSPNNILVNRNKLQALKLMREAKVNVASFIEAGNLTVAKDKNMPKLPLIGRTFYHQGGKGFWMCPTMTHVSSAISDGAQYFQSMIEIKEEFRLHIFNDGVIYAVKKSKKTKEEYQESYITQELESQKKLAEKNNNPFDEATAKLIIERMAKKKVVDGADMIIRSNRLGWKFSHIKTVNDLLKKEAVKALKALKLDFGAVDCCIDVNNRPYIIEINTGPGLEKTSFDNYVKAFKLALDKKVTTNESKSEEGSKSGKTKAPETTRDRLLAKATLFTEIIEKSNEEEAEALKGVFKKMFD